MSICDILAKEHKRAAVHIAEAAPSKEFFAELKAFALLQENRARFAVEDLLEQFVVLSVERLQAP